MSRMRRPLFSTWILMRGKHFTCSSLYHCTPEGLKASACLFLFKWQQRTWVDTHILLRTHTHRTWQRKTHTHTHTHTHPPAVFTVSRVEEMPTAKNQWLHFLFFFPVLLSSPLSSLSLSFSRLSSGKHTIFIPSRKWSRKVIIIKPTWF